MAEGQTQSVPSRLFRRSLSLAPNAMDRSNSILTLKREPDGRLSWGDGIPAAPAPRRASTAEEGAHEAGINSPLLGSVQGDVDAASEPDARDDVDKRISFAMNASLVAKVLLLLAKAYAYYYSQSKAVLASAADSFVDIASQVVIAIAEHKMRRADPRFPVGRTRLETVGVVACAVIMTLSTLEVIQSSSYDLYAGIFQGILPQLDMGLVMYLILGAATGTKIVLWFYCVALQHKSDSMLALAEDHRNDILSNMSAIACGIGASTSRKVWWIDPAGAILISLYIVWSWLLICKNQVEKIVGMRAPEDFISKLEDLAGGHHDELQVDVIRAYYFGARFLVEMEVVMPERMSVRESHDIALILQHKVEAYEEVERAFVHVDYLKRTEPEHKVDYNLLHHRQNLLEPHDSLQESVHSGSLYGNSPAHDANRSKSAPPPDGPDLV